MPPKNWKGKYAENDQTVYRNFTGRTSEQLDEIHMERMAGAGSPVKRFTRREIERLQKKYQPPMGFEEKLENKRLDRYRRKEG